MNINSVKFRLSSIIVMAVAAVVTITLIGTSGMRSASDDFNELYEQGLAHSNRANQTLQLIGDARSALLLAFQHDPDSKFSSMHDHPVSSHIQVINQSLAKVKQIVSAELLPNLPPTGEERDLIEDLYAELKNVENLGFGPAIAAINQGSYSKSNEILLRVINPSVNQLVRLAQNFLDYQFLEAKNTHLHMDKGISYFTQLITLISLCSIVIIGLLSWFIIRRINSAINKVQQASAQVSAGDLRLRVELGGSDEFAMLAKHIDEIVSKFQAVINQMSDYTVHLASTAAQSSAVAVQTRQNVIEQQQQTQMVATAIHQFTSTVQEVAHNTAAAAEASQSAENATDEGVAVLQQTIQQINQLNSEISLSANIIDQLSQQSTEIGSVIDVIDSISEQTNLLALNAAIEAARAGEAGRGFAVVADEVRSLASRTRQSTDEIKTMITNLQARSSDSMQRMDLGSKQARVTVDVAEQAGEALKKIACSVETIANLNLQIATAAEQQSTVTNEINQNVTSINDISTQTAAGAEQSSEATLEIARLAEKMRGNVAEFQY